MPSGVGSRMAPAYGRSTRGGITVFLLVLCIVASHAAAEKPLESGTASASWYGVPDGAGDEAGACGYGQAVATPPFSSMVTAGPNHSHIYSGGYNCGKCYSVKCTSHEACSEEGVTVTVTDLCRRTMPCLEDPSADHFDLSGQAFGAMAMPGRADELRAAGLVTVQYEWVNCNYSPPVSNPNVVYPAFLIDPSSTAEDFSVTMLYVEGMATRTMTTLKIKNAGDDSYWQIMTTNPDRPASWKFTDDSGVRLRVQAPLSFQVIIGWMDRWPITGTTVTADNVIPVGWQAGHIYQGVRGSPLEQTAPSPSIQQAATVPSPLIQQASAGQLRAFACLPLLLLFFSGVLFSPVMLSLNLL